MSQHKILILSNDSSYTYNLRDVLLERFVNEGFEVVVCCECLNYKQNLLDLGVKLIDVKFSRHSINPFSNIALLKQYKKIILTENPDVVLTYNIKPNVYGGIACKSLRIPYIPNITGLGIAVKNAGIVQKISKQLYKVGMSGASCVMFQNIDNKMFFIENDMLGEATRTCLLPGSGVNLEKFTLQPYPENNTEMVFSIIGRIMKDKGTDELLEAVRLVKNKFSKTVFRMIGYFDDKYQKIIMRSVKEGLIEYYEEQQDIRQFIKESWAVIQPSHHEGMSNVLIESAACGRPVIATDIPGCRETFDNNVSGFAFPVGDVVSLAKTIIQFIELPHHKKVQMGLEGRAVVEKKFDRNFVASAYLEEVKKVLFSN